ncbi:hypothetical protein [Micromonospora sp. MH33]|uniref:hypothetical protein n=1 Tax=Micromonospora sp. MH33 TaxID=1945509 RepID=UPI001AEFA59E|nr:hypothetical protein [Micromonospora sp. MH33]
MNQRHLLQVLREFEILYNEHRPYQGIADTRPVASMPNRSPTRTGSPNWIPA